MECSVVKSITDNNNCATTRHVYCQAARRRPAVPTFNLELAAAGEINFFFHFTTQDLYQQFTTPRNFFSSRLYKDELDGIASSLDEAKRKYA